MFSLMLMFVVSLTCVCLCCVFSLAPGSSPTSVTAWRRRAAWSTCARFSGTMSSSGPTSRSVLAALSSPRHLQLHPVQILVSLLRVSGSLNVPFPVFVRLRFSGGRRTSSATAWSWPTWWRSLTSDWPNIHSCWRVFSRRRMSRRPATSSTAWWGRRTIHAAFLSYYIGI